MSTKRSHRKASWAAGRSRRRIWPNSDPPGTNPYPVHFDASTQDWRRPYAEQASLELERSSRRVSVSAAVNFNRALHLPRGRDINLGYGPPAADGHPTFVPINPNIANKRLFEPRGNSFYSAMILQAARRFSSRFTLDAHYTLSRATNDLPR